MWYLKKIPKILHVYFGGRKIPYVRYLTIKSFKILNPDWTIKFYYPQYPYEKNSWQSFEQKYVFNGDDYFDEIKNLHTQMMPIDFQQIGINNGVSEVYKSDFLRWFLLFTEGGLWSDMDILYFRPMNSLVFNNMENENIDTGACISKYGHSVGFMFGSQNNEYYATLWDDSRKTWDNTNYQSIGSILVNRHFPTIESIEKKCPKLHPINIPMDVVYAYNALDIKKIYNCEDMSQFTKQSIGLHWYAGHPLAGEFLEKTNGGKLFLINNVISKTITALSSSIPHYINLITNKTTKILDLGCGNKDVSSQLTAPVTTVDIWPNVKPDIIWDLNNIPLPFKDNSYEIILLIDVIEHLSKNKGFTLLEEIKRITSQKIILLTPLWWSENTDNIVNPLSPYFGNENERHLSLWKKEDFKDWEEITVVSFIGNYFLGKWTKS